MMHPVDLSAASAELVAHGRTTVSYTHLRAHETVLDLVCRLLLEKKNTDCLTDVIHVFLSIIDYLLTSTHS